MSREIYTKESREKAVKLSQVIGKLVAEMSSDMGLLVCAMHRWRREGELRDLAGSLGWHALAQLMELCHLFPIDFSYRISVEL